MAAGRNIGVAVDFSARSKNALRCAAASLACSGDRLVLIHVKSSYQYEQGVVHLWEQNGSPLIPLVELSDPRVSKIYGVAPDRETLEILTRAANHRGVLMGSVSTYVVNHATCPVTVVRENVPPSAATPSYRPTATDARRRRIAR